MKIINKYIIELDKDQYVSGFYATLNDVYDFEGQMSDFPNACDGYTKFIDGQFIEDETKKQEIIDKENKQLEIERLKKQLADTDYIWNVIEEGDATEEDYAEVIANRKAWRARIRELEN